MEWKTEHIMEAAGPIAINIHQWWLENIVKKGLQLHNKCLSCRTCAASMLCFLSHTIWVGQEYLMFEPFKWDSNEPEMLAKEWTVLFTLGPPHHQIKCSHMERLKLMYCAFAFWLQRQSVPCRWGYFGFKNSNLSHMLNTSRIPFRCRSLPSVWDTQNTVINI